MSIDVVTFGCRLNAAESEVIRREAENAGLTDTVVVNTCAVTAEAVRQARQTIRALRRANGRRRRSSSPAARRKPSRKHSPPCRKPIASSAIRKSSAPRCGGRRARLSKLARHRKRSSTTSWPSAIPPRIWSKVFPAAVAPSSRCRTAVTIVVPFALFPMAAAIRAPCPWVRSWPMSSASSPIIISEIVLTGVDLTSYGADLPGAPKLGTLVKQILEPRPRAQAAAAFVHRFHRGRPRSRRCFCGERSPDAAFASVASGRRRSHSQADEAASHAPGCYRLLPPVAPLAPGHRVRRRPDRRISHGDGGDVFALARSGRRVRADALARVSIFAAAGDPGRPHAAA